MSFVILYSYNYNCNWFWKHLKFDKWNNWSNMLRFFANKILLYMALK